MSKVLNVGILSGNTYANEEWRVKEFENIYANSPKSYAEWFVTCKINMKCGDNRDVFKAGVTYRIHDKAYNSVKKQFDMFEISDGHELHWIDLNDLERYFKPAVNGYGETLFINSMSVC